MIVLYDPEKRDWNEVLQKAWASRPPGEVGMIVCIPEGGRLHRERIKSQPDKEKTKDRKPILFSCG